MARIVKAHSERQQEILNVAQQLFYTKGYETTSVQDIIDQVGIAKGTFYHYFPSKTHLLDVLVEQLVCNTLQQLEPILNDPQLNALDKLHQFFFNVESWKLENKSFLLDILRAWHSDENIILRTRLERAQLQNFAATFALIIEQGCQEGVFSTSHPLELAHIILAIMQDFSHRFLDLILNPSNLKAQLPNIVQQANIYQQAIEQLLGASPGSIHIFNPERLKQWF
jgi:AcrR family transcriptional regulator